MWASGLWKSVWHQNSFNASQGASIQMRHRKVGLFFPLQISRLHFIIFRSRNWGTNESRFTLQKHIHLVAILQKKNILLSLRGKERKEPRMENCSEGKGGQRGLVMRKGE